MSMGTLVMIRHGESRWNLDNRFSGWVDVPLSANGIEEAEHCSSHCEKFEFDMGFTSNLERAQSTILIVLSKQDRTGIFQHKGESPFYHWTCYSNRCAIDDIPIYIDERLNERYYGALQGLDKREAEKKYGEERVLRWRRGYADRPPRGESLEDTFHRVIPYFTRSILPHLKKGKTILLAAHGNTLRAIIKHLEGTSDDAIAFVDLPKAKPIVYQWKNGSFKHLSGDFSTNRPLR